MVIDIGAHTGDTTVPMALCAGKNGIVLGLEPNPSVYKILDQNSKLNKELTRIVPLNFAATDTDGKFTFNYSDASFCNGGFFQKIKNQKHGHKYTLEVAGKNFEKFMDENYAEWLPKLSMIKVDAEGYDKEILKSIINILKAFKPVILSECNKHLLPEERFELYTLLHDIGYKISMVPNFEVSTLEPLERKEDMLKWKHFDIVAQ
jgi:FkbM family methyltransferase